MKVVEYTYHRLCFQADIIEPLNENDSFIVHTPEGSFQFTKREFYDLFPNVIKTKSYIEDRIYHYPTTPQRALHYKI